MSFYLREPMNLVEKSHAEVQWEECACLLCGKSNWSPLVEGPDRSRGAKGLWFMVVQCDDCGLCFTNPRPGAMRSFYGSDYKPHQLREGPTHGARWWRRLPFLRSHPDSLRKALPLHGQGRLLDFGCGSGSFLLRMRQQGWKVTGIDMSEEVVRRLRGEHGVEALAGSLPHASLDPASFDVITMWQTLEHVYQPLEVLEAARQLLGPEGKLIVSVPNIDSLAFRWFGSAWNGLDLPRHLVHFTPETLQLMLESAGFHPGRVSMVRRSGWLRASARLARRHFPHQQHWFHWLERKLPSTLASWYGYWTGQADCLLTIAYVRNRQYALEPVKA